MMQSISILLQAAAANTGVQYHASYGGRGMYGRKCIGISGHRSDLMRTLAEVIRQMVIGGSVSDDMSEITEVLEYRDDQMGFDQIFYWEDQEHEDALESSADVELGEWVANASEAELTAFITNPDYASYVSMDDVTMPLRERVQMMIDRFEMDNSD